MEQPSGSAENECDYQAYDATVEMPRPFTVEAKASWSLEVECPINVMALHVPTGRRSVLNTRLRDLRNDQFLERLVKKRGNEEKDVQVTVDTQEEHEVAEALSCLANIKGDLSRPRGRSRPIRSRKAISKRKSALTRRYQDEGSLSSGSFERPTRTRTRSRSGRVTHAPFRTMFREGGKRVYHPQPRTAEPIRRHVIHQQPVRSRQKQSRGETTVPERVMLNGRRSREEERSVPDEHYLPVAVMDALKGIYGRGLICTDKQTNKESVHQMPSIQILKSGGNLFNCLNKAHRRVHKEGEQYLDQFKELKCDERSNESEAGTPLARPHSNNARHIYAAHLIQSQMEKAKGELELSDLAFGRHQLEDLLKNLPMPSYQEEIIKGRSFYPSLPMPSSYANFSMSLPSLPPSLIQTLQNPASTTRFPPLSGHPPPLVRASEPREIHP